MAKLVRTGIKWTMVLCFMLLLAASPAISVLNSVHAVETTVAASDEPDSADDDSGAETTSNWD